MILIIHYNMVYKQCQAACPILSDCAAFDDCAKLQKPDPFYIFESSQTANQTVRQRRMWSETEENRPAVLTKGAVQSLKEQLFHVQAVR